MRGCRSLGVGGSEEICEVGSGDRAADVTWPGWLSGEGVHPLQSLRSIMGRGRPQAIVQSELIATLNEVAGAVSSAMSVSEVLDVIVDRAKRITDTDKAVLVLADEHGEHLDLETLVVRGRRSQHDQYWWEPRIHDLSEGLFKSGEPLVEHSAAERALLLCSPVLVKDRPIGVLAAINSEDRPFASEQIGFLSILSAFAASAIENARLSEQSRYVLLASERDRIAREMHDGVVQSLFSISLGMEVCKKQLQRDPVAVESRLDELQEHLKTSMTELRRFIYDLRPMKLTELGLVGAVEYWVSEITVGRPLQGHVRVSGEPPRMTPAEEACLYRVAKEAVSNVVRHASANKMEVHIGYAPNSVRLEVQDDGLGFDTSAVINRGTDGFGLRSISERVRREGGDFSIHSEMGRGTRLTVDLPIPGARR